MPSFGHGGPGGRNAAPERAKDFGKTLKQLLSYLKDYKLAMFFVIVFAIGSTVLTIVGPKILGNITTEIFNGLMRKISNTGGIDFAVINHTALILVGLYIISALFSGIQGVIMAGVSNDISYRLRNALSEKINKLPMKYFDTKTHGEVLSIVTNDIDTLSQALNQSITTIITSIATIIGIFIMMISINIPMTIAAVLIIPVCMLVLRIVVRRSQKYFAMQQDYLGHINGHVEKFVKFDNVSKLDNCKISSTSSGKINTEKLIKEIRENWYSKNKPAILVLTWGTTKTGEKDDIKIIQEILKKEKIPYYLHIDAALYGGIPNNQDNAPIISNLNIDFDSIAISLHKYIGSPKVNGIIIAKKKTNHKYIDYIGQEDTTYLGSRDSLNFSVYQQIKELFYRSKNNEYMENIEYMEELLKKMNIAYSKCEDGNIFVLDKVSDKLCEKYQLSSFEKNGKAYIHIVIFPYQKKEYIERLVKEIYDEYNQKYIT